MAWIRNRPRPGKDPVWHLEPGPRLLVECRTDMTRHAIERREDRPDSICRTCLRLEEKRNG